MVLVGLLLFCQLEELVVVLFCFFPILQVVMNSFGVDFFYVLVYVVCSDVWVVAVIVSCGEVVVVKCCLFHVFLAAFLFY